jgi:hypothetical protein
MRAKLSRVKARKYLTCMEREKKMRIRRSKSMWDKRGGRVYYKMKYGVDITWRWLYENGLFELKKLIERKDSKKSRGENRNE